LKKRQTQFREHQNHAEGGPEAQPVQFLCFKTKHTPFFSRFLVQESKTPLYSKQYTLPALSRTHSPLSPPLRLSTYMLVITSSPRCVRPRLRVILAHWEAGSLECSARCGRLWFSMSIACPSPNVESLSVAAAEAGVTRRSWKRRVKRPVTTEARKGARKRAPLGVVGG
jgi:hypothetical protein